MRSKRNPRPHWKRLYLIVLMMIGGLMLEHSLQLTSLERKVAISLVVVVIYGLIAGWIRTNTAALQDLDAEKYRELSHNPAVYGTKAFPTCTQAHFREVMAFSQHKSPEERK